MAASSADFKLREEYSVLVTKFNKLTEDFQRLKSELRTKDALLARYVATATAQFSRIADLNATLQQTPAGDITAELPALCSTPQDLTWSYVARRGSKRRPSPPVLTLSNRFDALSGPPSAPPPAGVRDQPLVNRSAPPRSSGHTRAPAADAHLAGSSGAGLTAPQPASTPTPSDALGGQVVAGTVRARSPGAAEHLASSAQPVPVEERDTRRQSAPEERWPPHTSPRNHPPPNTMIVGDSIVRRSRPTRGITHCLSGAMVTDVTTALPGMLDAAPASIEQLVIHVGVNDTSLRHSLRTRDDFLELFNFLNECGKTVFISGPIPTLNRGMERFSRILSLNSWLQSACIDFNFIFIDNFNLFWNRGAFYAKDGLHPSPLGSRVFTDNILHVLHARD